MVTQTLDTDEQSYADELYCQMIRGVNYHLPISEEGIIRVATIGHPGPSFTYAFEEVSRDRNIVEVRKVTDESTLRFITNSLVELAAIKKVLSGSRIKLL